MKALAILGFVAAVIAVLLALFAASLFGALMHEATEQSMILAKIVAALSIGLGVVGVVLAFIIARVTA